MKNFFTKKLALVALLSLCIMAGALFLWWKMQGKAYGSITQKPLSKGSEEKKIEAVSVIRYKGDYITFLYPINFHVPPELDPPKNPLLERFFAVQNDSEAGQRLAVMVSEFDGQLHEFPGYIFRKERRNGFTEEKIRKNGLDMTLFTKNSSPYEVGVFFLRKKTAVSVVFSSPVAMGNMRELLLSLLESITWGKRD